MIKIKQVTNNLYDVFFGKFGWESKEHLRVKFHSGKWVHFHNNKKPNQNEVDYGSVVNLDSIVKEIERKLNDFRKSS